MYDPKFTQKQMYDQYGKSKSSTKPNPGKQFADSMKAGGGGRNMSGIGASPASSRPSTFDQFKRRDTNRGLGSRPITFGGGQDNNPNRDEAESRGVVARVYERAVTRFRNFGASEPDDVIVDGKKVYQGPAFRGFTPTVPTENFGGEYGKKSYFGGMGPNFGMTNYPRADVSPTLPPSTINIFGVNRDNPRLNMFGVERGSFRNPDPLELSVPPDVPANVDAITRALSQGMRPEPTVIDGEPVATIEVKPGQTLFDIRDEYNESILSKDKKITVEDIRKFNNISLDGMFGIKPGTELKLPIRTETEVDRLRNKVETERSLKRALIEFQRLPESEKEKIRDRYRLLEQAQPVSADASTMDFVKAFRLLRQGKIDEAAQAVGIGVEKDQEKVQGAVDAAVGLGSKQYKIKKGDTLSKIARAKGFTLSQMKKANPNMDYDNLKIGDTIKLPQAGAATETVVPEVVTNIITPVKDGKLNIGTGNRDDYPDQAVYGSTPLLSMDYNGGGGRGVEVIVPDWVYEAGPGNIYFDAAQKYIDSVIKFANDKGYGGYKPRKGSFNNKGIKSTTMNDNRGKENVIHLEPFFHEDKKMVDIINNHKEEFFDLYYDAFKDLPTTIIPPHGTIRKGVVDPGAPSDTFGSELSFGREAAEYLTNKYGNK